MSISVLSILQSGIPPRVKLWLTNVFYMYMQCALSQRYHYLFGTIHDELVGLYSYHNVVLQI